MTGVEKTENRDENGKDREERGPLMNNNFELKGVQVQVQDESEDREAVGGCSLTGNYLRNNVQRQRHTDKLLGSSTNGPDPVFHSCLGTKGPNPN